MPGTLPPARISFVRRCLGDEAIQSISYYGWGIYSGQTDKMAQLTKAFPEAQIYEIHPEPCHPGCFPAGTLVQTSAGPREIETLAEGDEVTTVAADDRRTTAQIQTVSITHNVLWEIETAGGTLVTTQTQPLCLADGSLREAGKIQPGDKLRQELGGTIYHVEVVSVTRTARHVKVYNVVLGNSEVFIAGGFLARSKPPVGRAESVSGGDRP
jgi:hypothetical protein